jgi:ABC-type antimicrobial peptide transport system permease subunit
MPFFNSLTGKALMLSFTDNYFLISGLIVLAILIGLISGAYPSLILSGFHPVSVIKGKIKTSASSLFIRRGLVLLQFTISIILIVGTVVVDQHFLDTYGMEIIDGRNFSKSFPTDEAEAYLLAWPLAYSVSHSWLQRFAYRISLSFAPFLFSGMLAMIIAFITVSFLSIKAANANPVDSLLYE